MFYRMRARSVSRAHNFTSDERFRGNSCPTSEIAPNARASGPSVHVRMAAARSVEHPLLVGLHGPLMRRGTGLNAAVLMQTCRGTHASAGPVRVTRADLPRRSKTVTPSASSRCAPVMTIR